MKARQVLQCEVARQEADLGFVATCRLGQMAYREFVDSTGVRWRAWSTVPVPGAVFRRDMEDGWLTFESDAGRRRLAPLPRAWEEASPQRLELMCRAAEQIERTSPLRGIAKPPVPEERLPDS